MICQSPPQELSHSHEAGQGGGCSRPILVMLTHQACGPRIKRTKETKAIKPGPHTQGTSRLAKVEAGRVDGDKGCTTNPNKNRGRSGRCRPSASQDGPPRSEHSGKVLRLPQIATEDRARVSPKSPLLLARVAATGAQTACTPTERASSKGPMEIARSG
jgi:hypothetical protein